MIIVAGHLQVPPHRRDLYLEGCRDIVSSARRAEGCLDFALSPDLLDPGRINVFERWASVDDLEAFRGAGPGGPHQDELLQIAVEQYDVGSSLAL